MCLRTNDSFICCCYVKAVPKLVCQNENGICLLWSALLAVYVLCWSTGKLDLCVTASATATDTQPNPSAKPDSTVELDM